jgi:lipopolysaccharide/colanic/teichoic acid biosynthesis glycosyltransferase
MNSKLDSELVLLSATALNFSCAVASFFVGLICSPQFKYTILFQSDSKISIWDFIIYSSCIAISSAINGHNQRMFERSRLDCFVNIIVATAVGCFLSISSNYVLRYYYVGRWVVFISSITYIGLICLCYLVLGKIKTKKVSVVFFDGLEIQSVLESVKCVDSRSRLEFINLNVDLVAENREKFSDIFNNSAYILISRNDRSLLPLFSGFDSRIYQKFRTVDYFIENEFSVVNPESVVWINWWEVPTGLRDGLRSITKRIFDILLVSILALPAVILVIVAAICIKIEDGGPVFYRQIRFGQFRLPFSIVKLRSMRVASEKNGAQWASRNDNRATIVGRILRKTRVDELPQLWNVLRGEMSMIGPRPERPEFYQEIEKFIPNFGLRLACKPGLTGWAQVNYPYGASIEDARNKLLFDLFYIKNSSFIFDLRVSSRTVVAMARGAR